MYGWLASLGAVPLAAVLVFSGRLKLTSSQARKQAAKSALGRLVGADRAPAAYAGIGVLELGVAGMLVLGATPVPGLRTLAAGASTALCAGFVAFLTYSRIAVPDASCGCVSARVEPVTWRSIARAAAMLALAAATLFTGTGWATAVAGRPVAALGVVVGEGAALVLLSPELDHTWLWWLRRLRLRMFPHPLSGDAHDVPLASTLAQLHASGAYRGIGGRLRTDVLDTWDDGEWRIVCYGTGSDTAVFAVPRLRYEPEAVRLAVVPN